MAKQFDNENRNRYYGLRVGDTVELLFYHIEGTKAEVIGYGVMDNNRVTVKIENGSVEDWVAEWCKIITKVEAK